MAGGALVDVDATGQTRSGESRRTGAAGPRTHRVRAGGMRIAAAVGGRALVDVDAARCAGARITGRTRAAGPCARRVGAGREGIAAAVARGALVDVDAADLAGAGVAGRAGAADDAGGPGRTGRKGITAPIAHRAGRAGDVGVRTAVGPRCPRRSILDPRVLVRRTGIDGRRGGTAAAGGEDDGEAAQGYTGSAHGTSGDRARRGRKTHPPRESTAHTASRGHHGCAIQGCQWKPPRYWCFS